MATSTISNTIKDASGVAVSGVTVVARLKPGPAFRVSDGSEIAGQVTTTTNGSGVWTLALEQTANITPTGTWWEIEEQIPDMQGGRRTWAIQVGAINTNLQASVVQQPPGGDVIGYLTQATGDGRYSSAVPAGTAVQYVTTVGNDSYNGLTWGSAKATIVAAVAALPASGGIVYVDAGTYTSASTIVYRGNVAIIGAGSGVTGVAGGGAITKLVYTGTGDAIAGDTTNTGWIPSVRIQGVQIDTNGSVNAAASGIHVWNAHDFVIEDVVIGGNFADGLLIGASAINGDNLTVRSLRVEPFGGGRFINRGIRVVGETNQCLFERVLLNIGDASGTAGGRGDSCVRVDGMLLNATFISPGFITATNGFATFGSGQASNVWLIAPHFEGAIVNQMNLINANDTVHTFGGPGGGVGTMGAYPNQGLLIRSDGRITTAVDGHVGLRVMRNNSTQTANVVQVEKENLNPMFSVGPKGQVIVQPDDTANPLLWVIGPASLAANLAEFRNNAGTTLAVRSDGGLAHPAAGLGFYGASPVTSRPTVSGSRGGNAALASVLTVLASLGLVTDSTTA